MSTQDDQKFSDVIEPPPDTHGFLGFLRGPWVRVVIFFVACFVSAPLYYGWQQFALMLGRSGAYEWLCTESDLPLDDVYQCEAQEKAITRLYSIAAGCEYASAAWGGIFLDNIGPRISGMVGELTWALGLLLLLFCSRSFQLYIPAMVILGSSVNVVAYPSLVTIETWPQWRGLMVGLMLSAQNFATLVPTILWSSWNHNPEWTFHWIWLVYLLAFWVPSASLYVCALPSNRDYANILKLQRKEILEQQEGLGITPPDDVADEPETGAIQQREATWTEFFHSLMTTDMIIMAVWFFCMMCVYAYYPAVVRSAIAPEISDYMAWFMPTQGVWSLCVGFVCDWFRTPWVMVGMCSCLIVIFSISLTKGTLWQHYLAATILTISQCAIFEVKFTFVSEMFDPYHYGKLVGLLGIVGGVGTFVNIPVADQTSYSTVFIIYICLMPVLIAMAAWLGIRQRRGKTYKSIPELVNKEALEI